MAMRLILPLIFSLLLSGTKQEEPGMKLRLTLKGLQYGCQVASDALHNKLLSRPIPDINGSVEFIFHYSATQIQIKKLDLSDSKLVYVPDIGIKSLISNGQIVVTGHLKIFYPWIKVNSGLGEVNSSISTNFEMSVSGLSFTGKLGITSDDKGRLKIWNEGCSSNVDKVNIRFHGGSDHRWLLAVFKEEMKKHVHIAFHRKLCPEFDKMIEHAETLLTFIPVVRYVDSVSSLEYQLVDPPLIKEQSLDIAVKGQFIGHSQRWDFPGQPVNLVLPEADSYMALLALSEFSANSAGYVHYMSGILSYNVTEDMVPSLLPIHLTTTSLAVYAPEITTQFPNSPPLLLRVSAHSPPAVSCQPDILTLNTSVDMQLYAMYPEKPPIPIFQIKADVEMEAEIRFFEKSLGLSLSLQNCSLTLVKSDTGLVKVDALEKDLCGDLKNLGLLYLNIKLKNLVSCPVPRCRFQNPVVRYLKGYLIIMTDFEVNLPPIPSAWAPFPGDAE